MPALPVTSSNRSPCPAGTGGVTVRAATTAGDAAGLVRVTDFLKAITVPRPSTTTTPRTRIPFPAFVWPFIGTTAQCYTAYQLGTGQRNGLRHEASRSPFLVICGSYFAVVWSATLAEGQQGTGVGIRSL